MTKFVFSAYDQAGFPLNANKVPCTKKNLSAKTDEEVQTVFNYNSLVQQAHWLRDSDLHITVNGAKFCLTFISEGAGYYNALGYYVYSTNSPPQSVSDIAEIRVLIANFSSPGEGSFVKGDSVPIPFCISFDETSVDPVPFVAKSYEFPAGTSIGWVLFANGWDGTGIQFGAEKFFSNADFNPETQNDKKHHVVAVLSETRYDSILYGIEDLNREQGSDDDFDDMVFMVSTNGICAVNPTSYNTLALKELLQEWKYRQHRLRLPK